MHVRENPLPYLSLWVGDGRVGNEATGEAEPSMPTVVGMKTMNFRSMKGKSTAIPTSTSEQALSERGAPHKADAFDLPRPRIAPACR